MKVLILTHKADIDGLSPVIFLKLIHDEVDSLLLNANDINPKVTELIKNKSYLKYDEIYITDLTLDKATCELIMSTGNWDRFHTFDHHAINLVANEYQFGTAISTNADGVNECATSLFYKYLTKRYPETFNTKALQDYTELVRLSDTWDWAKTNNLDANKLADLLSILGRDEYITTYTEFFKNNQDFYFTDNQKYLLDVEEKRIKRYLEESEKTMFHATLCGRPCGVVFAESHRSLLGNYLAEKYAYMLDYIVIINMQQGISFRAHKDNVNVGEIATIYGGGGHVKASGAPLDNTIKRKVIKILLNDKHMFNKQ
jgi:oligoribonuclease NrnB/cAMP/cGMP phosphodiesterase (DHH superfamily)